MQVLLDQLRASYPWLVFDGIEDLVDGEPQRGEVLFLFEGSDVGGFFDSPLSLAVVGFCSGMRRIGLIVGVIFMEGG